MSDFYYFNKNDESFRVPYTKKYLFNNMPIEFYFEIKKRELLEELENYNFDNTKLTKEKLYDKYKYRKLELGEIEPLKSIEPTILINKKTQKKIYLYTINIQLKSGNLIFLEYYPKSNFESKIGGIIRGEKIFLYIYITENDYINSSLKTQINKKINEVNEYINLLNKEIETFNNILKNIINEYWGKYDERQQQIERFLNGIEIKTEKPIIKEKIQSISEKILENIKCYENLEDNEALVFFYNTVIEIISISGEMLEQDSVYYGKEEELLRSNIANFLKIIPNVTISTEHKNRYGKTDISILVKNKNMFIVECKKWGGKKIFEKTYKQLLRYLTERENNCSIVIFNETRKNKKQIFQEILEVMNDYLKLYFEQDGIPKTMYIFNFSLR